MRLERVARRDRTRISRRVGCAMCTQRASFRFLDCLRWNTPPLRPFDLAVARNLHAETARKITSGKIRFATRRRGKWNVQRINHARFSRNSKSKMLCGASRCYAESTQDERKRYSIYSVYFLRNIAIDDLSVIDVTCTHTRIQHTSSTLIHYWKKL